MGQMDPLTAAPVAEDRDDRKTASLTFAQAKPQNNSKVARGFAIAREILRSPNVVQAARGADQVKRDYPEHLSVFFLDGDLHKKRRGQIARFFTPKAMKDRYRVTMEKSTHKLVQRLRESGREQLDVLSFELACDVASEIVGLTNSDPRAMALRIRSAFTTLNSVPKSKLALFFFRMGKLWKTLEFYYRDVLPAIRARRKVRKDDVISLIIDEGYSNKSILVECMTYGSAGMMTTREFIVVAAWHLFDNPNLRERYLTGGEQVQFAILEEILRIEPVVTFIHRRATDNIEGPAGEIIGQGEYHAVDVRAANLDEETVGANPRTIDVERAARQRMTSSWMSFGDGPHRCPGAQVALHETRVFLDALLRVPGVRLANPPTPAWTGTTYELHGAFVECDKG